MMGSALSCGPDCGRRCAGLDWFRAVQEDEPCLFSAEVYKLSPDQRRWMKVHPEVLSLRVRQQWGEGGGAGLALLEAASLQNGQRPSANGTTEQQSAAVVLRLQIPREAELKRYTEKFVYWRDASDERQPSSSAQVFALNVLSASDVDRFCSALRRLPPTPFLAPKCARDEHVFDAHLAPLMAVHRDRVEECPVPLFSRCRVSLHEGDATIRVLDEHGEHLLARTNANECIFCLSESSSGGAQLSVSFPARALLLQFPSPTQQLAFCRLALNASSARFAGTLERDKMAVFLRARMAALQHAMDRLGRASQSGAGPVNTDEGRGPAVLVCDCDPRAAMQRRQSMFGLLRHAMRTRLAALTNESSGAEASTEQFAESLAAADFTGPSELAATRRLHRVHLRALLACQFSLERTVRLLAKYDSAVAGEDAKCTQNAEHNENNKDAELDSPPPALGPTGADPSSAQQLMRVLLELVHSERAFVQDLEVLLSRFVVPSGLASLHCVHELARVHSQFLRSLEAALGPLLWQLSAPPLAEMGPVLSRVFALFSAKCAQFKVYSEFTFAHARFQRLRAESATFTGLIASFGGAVGGTAALDSLLIKPVQRLLKYPLFLSELRQLCAETSQERAQCLKALRQMRTLANWLNEMQRIQEDYGAELAQISHSANSSTPSHCAQQLADLNLLQLFAHVRWENAPQTGSETEKGRAADCVLLVFRSVLVVMRRKKAAAGPMANSANKANFAPLMLPLGRVLLLHSAYNGTPDGAPVRFALAILQDPSEPAAEQLLVHFECCHPSVCAQLALILRQRKGAEGRMASSWSTEMSTQSSLSSSSDRGYASSTPEQPDQRRLQSNVE